MMTERSKRIEHSMKTECKRWNMHMMTGHNMKIEHSKKTGCNMTTVYMRWYMHTKTVHTRMRIGRNTLIGRSMLTVSSMRIGSKSMLTGYMNLRSRMIQYMNLRIQEHIYKDHTRYNMLLGSQHKLEDRKYKNHLDCSLDL